MSKLKVMYIVSVEAPPDVIGGLGRYIERMIAAWEDAPIRFVLFAMTLDPRVPKNNEVGSVTIHHMHGLRIKTKGIVAGTVIQIFNLALFNMNAICHILWATRGRHDCAVAIHDWMACPSGILCRLLTRMPVIFHIHSFEMHFHRNKFVAHSIQALEKYQCRLASAVIVPSYAMKTAVDSIVGFDLHVIVIPHGWNDPTLVQVLGEPPEHKQANSMLIRHQFSVKGDEKLLVYAGRFAPHKGVIILLRAIAILRRRIGRNIVTLLVGDGASNTTDTDNIKNEISRLHLENWVYSDVGFLPSQDLYHYFLSADVCVFPSTYEPFGLVATEAMALGKPVVVGVGYSPDVIGNGAIRCPSDSPQSLADSIELCLLSQEFADALGARASIWILHSSTWKEVAESTLQVYNSALS